MEKWNQTRQPGGVGRLILRFEDWSVSAAHDALGYQLDNETRELTLLGDLPQGWTWDVLVQAQGKTDIWPLALTDEGAKFTLTDENLSIKGPYCLQVRGTKGSQVRHCNAVTVYVLRTLAGTVTWPTLPTEFAQAEKNIKELNAHPPIPGENGFWLLWDLETSAYIESQLSVPVGPAGPANTLQIGTVETLEPGQTATAQIIGEAPNQTLSLGIPQGQTGKTGATPALEIGQVETLEPGEPATAELTGTPEAPVLSLGIPRGEPGEDGVQLNDDAINTTEAWSSKKIVDTLCPPFSVSGNPVTCHPVEGYPLGAVVSLEPKQAGSGDPSPDNVRPISGYDSVTVTQSKDEAQVKQITLTLPETIYGGTVDAATGVGSKEWSVPISLTGEESWDEPSYVTAGYKNYRIVNFFPYVVDKIVSSHFLGQANTAYSLPPYNNRATSFPNTPQLIVQVSETVAPNVESWKSYLATQASAGTPVQVAYKLATPEPFEVTPHPIPALPGVNTLYTDGDSLTVTGRRDLVSALEDLQTTMTAVTTLISEGGLT